MLKPLWVITRAYLKRACSGNVGVRQLFDGAAFRKAAARIVAGGGYTDFDELEAEIGVDTMAELIKSNLLAIRPPSDWARDLPAMDNNLATAVSATALFCMRKLQAEGLLTIEGGGRCHALLPPPPIPPPPLLLHA